MIRDLAFPAFAALALGAAFLAPPVYAGSDEIAPRPAQLDAVQLGPVQLGPIQLGPVQLDAAQLDAAQLDAAQLDEVQLDEVQLDEVQLDEGKRTYVVAAMGDSLTDPKSQGGKYLTYLKTKCPKSTFDSYGKGGNMVNQMRKRFARDVLGEGGDGSKPSYTHVIILGGIGDILSNETATRTSEKIQKDLGTMYQLAHDKGVSVIALTLPPWGAFKAYDDARHTMTMEENDWINSKPANVDSVVDIYPLLSCGKPRELCDDYAWPDKLHWGQKGHDVVGAALYASVFSDCE